MLDILCRSVLKQNPRKHIYANPSAERQFISEKVNEFINFASSSASQEEMKTDVSESVVLNLKDGTTIDFDSNLISSCTDIFFNPSKFCWPSRGHEDNGLSGSADAGTSPLRSIHELIIESISRCDQHMWRPLFANINLCGGVSLYPGFAAAVEENIINMLQDKNEAPKSKGLEASGVGGSLFSGDVMVVVDPDLESRRNAVWRGAAALSEAQSFASSWISREQYEEYGVAIMRKKCL